MLHCQHDSHAVRATLDFPQDIPNFFLYLYGKQTVSRIQLVLTDNDAQSHGALASVKILEDCWSGVVTMLCLFHGLVMVMHKTVWPKLPHSKANPSMLTKTGKLYCE